MRNEIKKVYFRVVAFVGRSVGLARGRVNVVKNICSAGS